MENYLYILPFKDGVGFKLGISSNNYNRIHKHNKTYNGINFEESIIVEGAKNNIKKIESILKKSTPDTISHLYEGKEGYTEIRDIKYKQTCLDDINYYKERLKLTIIPINKKELNKQIPTKNKTNTKKKNTKHNNRICNTKGINTFIKIINRLTLNNDTQIITNNNGYYKIITGISIERAEEIYETLASIVVTPILDGITNANLITGLRYDKVNNICTYSIVNPFEAYEECKSIDELNNHIEEIKAFKQLDKFIKKISKDNHHDNPIRNFIIEANKTLNNKLCQENQNQQMKKKDL